MIWIDERSSGSSCTTSPPRPPFRHAKPMHHHAISGGAGVKSSTSPGGWVGAGWWEWVRMSETFNRQTGPSAIPYPAIGGGQGNALEKRGRAVGVHACGGLPGPDLRRHWAQGMGARVLGDL